MLQPSFSSQTCRLQAQHCTDYHNRCLRPAVLTLQTISRAVKGGLHVCEINAKSIRLHKKGTRRSGDGWSHTVWRNLRRRRNQLIKSTSIPWVPPAGRQESFTCDFLAAKMWLELTPSSAPKTSEIGTHTGKTEKIQKEAAFKSAPMWVCVIQEQKLYFTIKHFFFALNFRSYLFGA